MLDIAFNTLLDFLVRTQSEPVRQPPFSNQHRPVFLAESIICPAIVDNLIDAEGAKVNSYQMNKSQIVYEKSL